MLLVVTNWMLLAIHDRSCVPCFLLERLWGSCGNYKAPFSNKPSLLISLCQHLEFRSDCLIKNICSYMHYSCCENFNNFGKNLSLLFKLPLVYIIKINVNKIAR